MAEFLIYNKDHWMDALKQEQIDEYVKKYPKFMDKYNARTERGNVIEVRPDGYWTGTKAKAYRKNTFLVVTVSGLSLKDAEQYGKPLIQVLLMPVWNEDTQEFETEWIPKIIKKRKFNFSNVTDKQTFSSISQVTITEKTLG